MSSVNPSLEKLRKLAPKLNKAADDAAKIVQAVENLISKELNIAVKAEVQIEAQGLSESHTLFRELCFRRVDSRFRIAIVESLQTTFLDENRMEKSSTEETSVVPWAECPRETKLESFPFLPQLLEKVVENSEAIAANIQKTQETIEQISPGLVLAEIKSDESEHKARGAALITPAEKATMLRGPKPTPPQAKDSAIGKGE